MPTVDDAPASVLFVTPQMPSFRGSGLAMRAAATLRLLSLWSKKIHLLVIPIYGASGAAEPEPEPEIAALISSWRSVARQASDGIAKPSVYWNHRLRGTVPEELTRWHEQWQQRINAAIAGTDAELVFVFRFYLAPFVLPGVDLSMPMWLDVDELESNARARLAIGYASGGNGNSNSNAARSRMEAVAYEKLEKDLLPRFARVFAASHLEAQLLRGCCPNVDAYVLPNSYPRVAPQRERLIDGKARLLFVGTFGYYPNVDALLYFAREILPIIKDRCALPVETAVIGLGLEPVGETSQLPGINCVGPVTETTPYYASCDIAIVPLRCGAGTRIKILEAFSHQRAVISTPLGAEGLNVTDNCELRIGGDPEQFAKHCLELLSDQGSREALALRGHDFFLQHHSATKLAAMIPELFGSWSSGQ